MKDPELIAFWREVVDGHERSGLTVREWCIQQQKSPTSFYRWRLYFARQDSLTAPGFVQVQVTPSASDELCYPVTLPNGLIIHVPAGFMEGNLRRLLSVLQQA